MSSSLLLSYSAARRDASADVRLLLGPIVIGVVLNIWLLGFVMAQCYTYYLSHTTAKVACHRWIKILVAFLLFVDVLNSGFNIAMLYDYTVLKFGDIQSVANATWLFVTDPILTVVVSYTVQTFLAWRVRMMTGRTWMGLLVAFLAFLQFLCGVGTSIAASIITDFTEAHRFQSIIIVWLVLAPITDATITLSLVWYLKQQRTGYRSSDELVSRIVRLTLQTGLITTIWVILDLAFFLAYPNNLHMIFHIPTSKIYTNSLMSSLNAIECWSKTSDAFGDTDVKQIANVAVIDRDTTSTQGVRIPTSTHIHSELQEENHPSPFINIVHHDNPADMNVVRFDSEYQGSMNTGDERKGSSLDGFNYH